MKTIRSFEKHLLARGLSVNAAKTYSESVKDYMRNYSTLSEKNVLAWRNEIEKRLKPSSVQVRVKGMNAYLVFSGVSYRLPSVHLDKIHHLEGVISLGDYRRLIRKLSEEEGILARRWLLLWKTIAMTGMRVSEVRQVRAEHIASGKALVYAKGGIYRTILMPKRLCKEIGEYLEDIKQNEGYIFGASPEKPYAIGTIEAKLHFYGKKYGLPKEVMHPHSLRHLFGKCFMAQKGDITMLADLMGHSSIETTRIYTRRTMDEQMETLDKIVTW